MHPAFSVIIFTSLSGAGYGSLAILAAVKYFDFFALNPLYGFLSSAISLLIVTVGLISSTTHLGHPRRAWRGAITVAILLAFKGRRFCSSLLFSSRCLLRIFSYSRTF